MLSMALTVANRLHHIEVYDPTLDTFNNRKVKRSNEQPATRLSRPASRSSMRAATASSLAKYRLSTLPPPRQGSWQQLLQSIRCNPEQHVLSSQSQVSMRRA